MEYKVVRVDNYDRELFDDEVVKEHLTKDEAEALAEALNEREGAHSNYYHLVREQGAIDFKREW